MSKEPEAEPERVRPGECLHSKLPRLDAIRGLVEPEVRAEPGMAQAQAQRFQPPAEAWPPLVAPLLVVPARPVVAVRA
jgi:hypothetical protein